MKNLGLNQIRKEFLDFFAKNNHYVRDSFPLVPINDKSLLLVNAGMQPLKSYFTGEEVPPSKRMATCQKCMRTVDVSNVGYTKRHATMFEMLGNFSFGDYFKEESLRLGWEFCTKVLEMDPDKLWPTIYEDDDEAFEIWNKKIGLPAEKIVRLGKDTNFWEIGTGPCGPCSEIHYDRGIEHGCGKEGCAPGCDCDRWLEFWNHVFSEFNRDEEGNYTPLVQKNIDTGMGLERLACLLQGVDSIFDIDVISKILKKVQSLANVDFSNPENVAYSKIITDHIKAVTFLVGDGVIPSNEGRGYVLRRILRRAARYAGKLGIELKDFVSIVSTVVDAYEEGYPLLREKESYILKIVSKETDRFAQTINSGLHILDTYMHELKEKNETVLSGKLAFKLYDTYGFPIELTEEILSESGLSIDKTQFDEEMKSQKERARAARQDEGWTRGEDGEIEAFETTFIGYNQFEADSKVLYFDGDELVLESTPFYPEGGGQIGDTGHILADGFTATVIGTRKTPKGTIIHKLVDINGDLHTGDIVTATIDLDRRKQITRNHSATHLLHKALRDVLGVHVEQAGSQLTEEKLRFDFTHFEQVSKENLAKIEASVNAQILDALNVSAELLPLEEAKSRGAMALFGEKYGDIARVITMGDYSIELCGGCHVDNTSKIGLFKIISESGIASGVRRIEAITGGSFYKHTLDLEKKSREISALLKTAPEEIVEKVETALNQLKAAQKETMQLKEKLALANLDSILEEAEAIAETTVITKLVDEIDSKMLVTLAERVMDKVKNGIIILASPNEDKVSLLAMVSEDNVQRGIKAGSIVKEITSIIGGGGGGRPNLAQASGKDISKLQEAFTTIKNGIATK